MSRRSSSQLGLFSAQVSEQVQRLRTLTALTGGAGDAAAVDLRRAVMATRLLAGSARILGLEELHGFLDELLDWLQRIEQSGKAPTTTQSLILESVIELEETVLAHIEKQGEQQADLKPVLSQIEDLTGLIQHNIETLAPARKTSAAAEPEPAGVVALDLTALGARVRDADTAELRMELRARIQGWIEELQSLQKVLDEAESAPDRPVWNHKVEGLSAVEDPAGDTLVGPATARLISATDHLGCRLEIEAWGEATTVAQVLRGPVSEILAALAQDIGVAIASDPEIHELKVVFETREDQGRVRLLMADNGPRGTDGLADADHLSMCLGLRRARNLIDQIGGLIRVEPRENPRVRFEVDVPVDPARPGYVVLTLEQNRIAIPASLYERTVRAAGLLYETDEGGESVQLHGRSVPVVDVAEYVGSVVPAADRSPFLVVTGAAEKRLSMACEKPPVIVRTETLGDPPDGWQAIAYGALYLEGEAVPVLDVKRLLQLRFRSCDEPGLAGSNADVALDAWDPAESPVSQKITALSGMIAPVNTPTASRAVLVNQSEFRRKEILRTLESAGMEVLVCDDLVGAVKQLESGDIDLLITDLRLGHDQAMSFPDLRSRHPGLRIVLTTSVAREYAEDLAGRTGADRCWLDPYRAADLAALLNTPVAGSRGA